MSATPLPSLRADLLLVHAPAVFDFRKRRDMYFPFLGTSGDVPITPLYEYFPVGFKTLQRFLGERGHDVRILNLASLFVRYPHLDADSVLRALDAPIVGIDLHWMIHVQGALDIARRLKAVRPDVKVLLGGISATYYAEELVRYPFVDWVMGGYDTHVPMAELLDRFRRGESVEGIPNLFYKDDSGTPRKTGLTYLPNTFACGIDWSTQPVAPKTKGLPIRELLSTQNAGCAYNCPWCGGSRDAFRRIFGRKKAMARKPQEEIRYELETIKRLENASSYHFYSVGSYNESPSGLTHFLDRIAETSLKSISFEQFHLTPDETLQQMARLGSRVSITLSPESHDPRIATLSGRGVYSNEEMESWIERALGYGIHSIDVWYFVGMPEQTRESAMDTVVYCERLLERFKGKNVNPMICPMVPFLDPASNIFESPERYGYKVFFRTAEEHRRGMERASLVNRMNYETKWLPRQELIETGYLSIRRLMEAKAAAGMLPGSAVRRYNERIDDALAFGREVFAADSLTDPRERERALDGLGDEIARRNEMVLFAGVANQAMPINRQVGGRWFDELGWDPAVLDDVASG
ncbi:MAG: cobalamin-dependent protein [Myxococcales bacterium]|nr:cobalamin-dependent protein [Myxococcales bacterium]